VRKHLVTVIVIQAGRKTEFEKTLDLEQKE
jgi:hypothetical protein